MTQLQRAVLVSQAGDQLQILPAGNACQQCPAPCRSVVAVPDDAAPANLVLSSGLLNRLALAFFGVPLLFIGLVLVCLDSLVASPGVLTLMVMAGAIFAGALGGRLAQRYLTDIVSALKSSGVG